jgi:muramoyltetrapeptide carboxypeptidase
MRIAIVATGTGAPELVFHPQCFEQSGHFAGDDAVRARAFLESANDDAFDAVWFARGGHGACRLAELIMPQLNRAARTKRYLGYSDVGFILAGLYRAGCAHVAHGPMPVDIIREGGAAAVLRSLAFLCGDRSGLEPHVSRGSKTAAFNITVLSHLLGTLLEPDLTGHVLMLEEVSEYMYRIDRALFHITSQPAIRRVEGIRLGRCSLIPPNEPDFGQDEEEVARHWCAVSGIPYLGRADVGHDAGNKIVPFGTFPSP